MTQTFRFRCARPLPKGAQTLIMGIVNCTPDSFSDGAGALPGPEAAADHALRLLAEGADIIDIGAESTRPGAQPVDADEEIRRLGDVIRRLRAQTDAPVSVDTYHARTAAAALDQGADIINDVTALRGGWDAQTEDGRRMAELAARTGAHVILMHAPAAPAVMQTAPQYAEVVADVRSFLESRTCYALDAGIAAENIWLDPGFGFGKTLQHNCALLRRLGELAAGGLPVVAGLSRKRMIADVLGLPPAERVEASAALAVLAAERGAAAVRVHDVLPTVRAVRMADAVCKA